MALPNTFTSRVAEPGRTGTTVPDDLYVVSVLLLCAECEQSIKATITTTQWIRCEWIGPSGECLACSQARKREKEGNDVR